MWGQIHTFTLIELFMTSIVIFRFPGRPDTMMTSPEHLEERRAALEIYLNTVLEQEMYREQIDVVSIRAL